MAGTAAVVMLASTASYFLFVDPRVDGPRKSDVLFVLAPAPADGARLRYAQKLMDEGYAKMLAVSVPLGEDGQPRNTICGAERKYEVLCFHPDPVTTQGEAQALRDLAESEGWKSANVLTVQSHITRARFLMQRCYKGELSMTAHWQDLTLRSWAYRIAYEVGAFVKVALNRDC